MRFLRVELADVSVVAQLVRELVDRVLQLDPLVDQVGHVRRHVDAE